MKAREFETLVSGNPLEKLSETRSNLGTIVIVLSMASHTGYPVLPDFSEIAVRKRL
jgi:NADPH-dependent curcumin reductase CurA